MQLSYKMSLTRRRILLQRNGESGFSLIEIMMSILILAVISLAVSSNLIAALRTAKFTQVNHAASSLAISKVEELAAIDTLNLDASYNATETSVAWPDFNINFTRTVVVTVNADESRTIDVTVVSNADKVPTTVEFTTTFAMWE